MVREARDLAISRLTMHRIGDKSEDEYRAQIRQSIADAGDFLEDEEEKGIVDAIIGEQMTDYDAWYQDYLSRMWEGAKTDG